MRPEEFWSNFSFKNHPRWVCTAHCGDHWTQAKPVWAGWLRPLETRLFPRWSNLFQIGSNFTIFSCIWFSNMEMQSPLTALLPIVCTKKILRHRPREHGLASLLGMVLYLLMIHPFSVAADYTIYINPSPTKAIRTSPRAFLNLTL